MVSSTLKRILGILCISFGLVSLLLPVVPGAIFIFIGMELAGLTFLLPKSVRTRWELVKTELKVKWLQWKLKRQKRKEKRLR